MNDKKDLIKTIVSTFFVGAFAVTLGLNFLNYEVPTALIIVDILIFLGLFVTYVVTQNIGRYVLART